MPPLHRRLRALQHLALALSLGALATGCKTTGKDAQTHRPGKAAKRAPNGAKLPKPLTLPAEAPAYAYLADPAGGLARLQALSPEPLSLELLVDMELGRRTSPELASAVAKAADSSRPWAGVELEDGEAVGHLPIKAAQAAALTERFASLPKQGEFGGVRLPSSGDASTEWMAWLREGKDGYWLTVGTSERALATGELLRSTYGEKPLHAGLDIDRLPLEGEAPPVERVWVSGELHDLTAKVRFSEAFDPTKEIAIEAGAMSELLADTRILLGGSSRVRGYEKRVATLISNIQEQVGELPFLIKGFASDLAARFNAIARSWNGRVAIAFADGHVRLAYGADDPQKAGVAVLHFLRGALDGISLARNFSSDVPDMRLKKNAQQAGDIAIHRLTLRNLKGVPKEAQPLLDDRRNLHIAMAFDAKLGGGVLAVGPESVAGLKAWIESTKGKVKPIAESPEASLRFALSSEQLRRLAEAADADLDITELWTWKAEGPPYRLDIRRVDERHWSARVQGPAQVKTATIAVPLQPASKAP